MILTNSFSNNVSVRKIVLHRYLLYNVVFHHNANVLCLPVAEMAESMQNLDIEQAVRDWAWRHFDDTATKKEKKLRAKEKKMGATKHNAYIGLDIDWSEVRFRDETRWGRITDADFQETEGDREDSAATKQVANNAVQRVQVHPRDHAGSAPDGGTPTASVLFQTKFTNNTGETQEYTMKTEKVTKTTCMTEIETSYTRGIEMGLTLKAPGEFLEANVGYSREFSLTNIDGQTFEEELHWGVDSLIKVKGNHEATAKLVVDECKQKGNFTIMSQVFGMVFVTFTNIRDNNSMLKATGHQISEIIKEYLDKQRRKGQPLEFVKVENGKVFVTTKGKCNFRYGIKQEVKVDQTQLSA